MRKPQNSMISRSSLWNYLVTSKQSGGIFSNFCGLLRMSEKYQPWFTHLFHYNFPFSDEYFRDYCGASTRSTIRHSSAKLVRTNYQWYQIRSSGTSLFATQKRPLYHKCQIGNCYFPLIFVQVKNYFSVGNFAWLFF